MRLIDPVETVLVVVGASLSAELKDEPLAYHLRQVIDHRGGGHHYRRALVVQDSWYMQRDDYHRSPTIAVGGPGANAVSQYFAGILPLVWSREERSYLQVAFEGPFRRATVWGMNADATREALDAFIDQGLLDRFLDQAWRFDRSVVM